MRLLKSLFLFVLSLAVLVFGLLLYLYCFPTHRVKVKDDIGHPSYRAAVQDATSVIRNEPSEVSQDCSTFLLDHGQKTDEVILLFHGYTTCPKQYEVLAQQLFEKGYNVYVPRAPYHGYEDVMTDDISKLTSQDLIGYVNESLETVSGLGNTVKILGLSGGGTLAAWAAYYYDQVEVAVLCSPFFMPNVPWLPYANQQFVTNMLDLAPNQYLWWNDSIKNNRVEGPLFAYPRFSTKGLVAYLNLSIQLRDDLESHLVGQYSGKVVMVTSPRDRAVRNDVIREYASIWETYDAADVMTYDFDSALDTRHDYIEPLHPRENIKEVYPILMDFIEGM